MTTKTTPRPAPEALAKLKELRELYGFHRGGDLTLKFVAAELGLQSWVTVSWWLSGKHEPKGMALAALNTFLDNCEKEGWLERRLRRKG